MSEGEKTTSPKDKKNKKTFAKPLDKSTKVWYNNSTVRENKTLLNKKIF
jgi:hypothetical protein